MSETAIVRPEQVPTRNGNGLSIPPVRVDTASITLMDLCGALAKSGYFKDTRDASQALVKVLYGQELGVGPAVAMMSIHIIEGKPSPSANLLASLVRRSGRYDYRVIEHSNDACELAVIDRGQEVGRVRWTMQDATRAEVAGKGNWKKYPKAMLFSRAISELARTYAPEVFGGAPVYTPDELGAEVNADGEVVTLPDGQRANTRTGEVIDVSSRVAAAAEQSASFSGATLDTSAPAPKALLEECFALYLETTGFSATATREDKVRCRDYWTRSLGVSDAPEKWTIAHARQWIAEMQEVPKLSREGHALAKEIDVDPAAERGEVLRTALSRVLDRPVETRKLVTAGEWRKWNAYCRELRDRLAREETAIERASELAAERGPDPFDAE